MLLVLFHLHHQNHKNNSTRIFSVRAQKLMCFTAECIWVWLCSWRLWNSIHGIYICIYIHFVILYDQSDTETTGHFWTSLCVYTVCHVHFCSYAILVFEGIGIHVAGGFMWQGRFPQCTTVASPLEGLSNLIITVLAIIVWKAYIQVCRSTFTT